MLNIEFQGRRRFGSGEDIFNIFTIYGHDGHRGSIRNLTLTGLVVSEEMFKSLENRRQTTEAYLYYKHTSEPLALVSLKHAPFPLSIFANKCSDGLYSHSYTCMLVVLFWLCK